jgi:predicted ArsR family transcriptional regulator
VKRSSEPATEGPTTASAAQLVAMANRTRVRIWTELGSGDRTISQLARLLGTNKGSVSHHLAVLVDTNLARRSTERTVRGGTEQYYARVASPLFFPHERGPDTASHAMMVELVSDIEADKAPRVHQRKIRLNPAQAAAFANHLDRLIHDLQPADDRHPLYGIATAIYRKP